MPAKTIIQLRKDTAANWTTANPVLAAGEPGVETDTNKVKLGNGTSTWSSLAYFGSLDYLDNIGDVIISSATSGQVLQFNGTSWVNATINLDVSGKLDRANGSMTTSASNLNVVRNIRISTSTPTGGVDGDIWFTY